MTIGEKIKKIRKLRNISQKELAFLVNLSYDRIRQYESDVRTPKEKQLQVFAESLGVPLEFFTNHKTDTYVDFLHTLFEWEDNYGLTLHRNASGKCILEFTDDTLNHLINEWYKQREKLNEENNEHDDTYEKAMTEYSLWKARFPQSMSEEKENLIQAEHERMSLKESKK